MSKPSTTPSRFQVNSKTKPMEPPPSPAQKARAKSLPPSVADIVKKDQHKSKVVGRSLVVNKPKSEEQVVASQKAWDQEEDFRVVVGRSTKPVVQQSARPRRPADSSSGRIIIRSYEEDQMSICKRELHETLIKDLQSQVSSLQAELDKAHCLNKELQSHNMKLAQDLTAAEAKIAALNSARDQESISEYRSPKFKDIQKLIANKLEHPTVKKEGIIGPSLVKTPMLQADDAQRMASIQPFSPAPRPPPPPPPLPLLRPLARAATAPRTPPNVEFYRSLRKQEDKTDAPRPGNQYKPATTSAHSSIVGEIQNRSAHLLAIKADIETKGDFINSLIQKVLAAAYTDIEDVLNFVDWLDGELSSLADEQAVLKHFKWPERKADAIREAAIEYRGLKLLENEISSYKDDTNIPCGSALKKMASLLDKSERSIQRLITLRNSVMLSYQVWKIPTDWMLDSGIVSKIKQASMNLVKTYMKRVISELELARNLDKESNQEALLLQGVHFAYRAYQFAGGLDSETLCAFEEIRRRVPRQLGGSRELLAAIPSS